MSTGGVAHPAGSIRLDGASKRYASGPRHRLPGRRPQAAARWALAPADLGIEAGEAVGVLGHNGAGKTTLLRLLAGVTAPSTGRLEVVGRVAPLISVGVGFHQELSGRENVRLNGQLLGLRRREVLARFDSIVELSGLDDVLDTPVKFYSSGMLLRLAFSVLVHLDADVMLVDEVLAVGDAAFQAKGTRRLRTAWHEGATLVLVSHSPELVRSLCPRSIVLHQGEIAYDGPSEEAVSRYWQLLTRGGAEGVDAPPVQLDGSLLTGPDGTSTETLQHGEEHCVRHRLRFSAPVDSPQVYFNVFDESGELVYQRLTTVGRRYRTFDAGEEAEVRIRFRAGMGVGRYRIATEVRSLDGRSVLTAGEGTLDAERRGPAQVGSADLEASIFVDGVLAAPGGALDARE